MRFFFRITRLPVKTPFIHYSPIHCRTQIEAQLGRGKKWNFWELNYSLFPIQFRRAWNIYSQASKTVNHSTPLLDCRCEPFCSEWKNPLTRPAFSRIGFKITAFTVQDHFFFSSADFIVESNGSTVSGTLSIWKTGGPIRVFCRII